MSDDQTKPSEELEPNGRKNSLHIEDIVHYLSRLANLHKEPRTGNVELSRGLQKLANALRPYSQRPIREIGDAVSKALALKRRIGPAKKPKVALPPDLESLSDKRIDEILNDRTYTKLQLIELGVQRFGISRSKLMRLRKDQVIESVRAALNHERSLGVISQEARRGGEKRSS